MRRRRERGHGLGREAGFGLVEVGGVQVEGQGRLRENGSPLADRDFAFPGRGDREVGRELSGSAARSPPGAMTERKSRSTFFESSSALFMVSSLSVRSMVRPKLPVASSIIPPSEPTRIRDTMPISLTPIGMNGFRFMATTLDSSRVGLLEFRMIRHSSE